MTDRSHTQGSLWLRESEADYFFGAFGMVLQPPLPLQEFLPLQPLSPDLQPPVPLHSLCPLQVCWPLSAILSMETPGAAFEAVLETAKAEPERIPVMAAAARMCLVLMMMSVVFRLDVCE